MILYTVGQTAALTFTVTPADGATTATAAATSPAAVTAPVTLSAVSVVDDVGTVTGDLTLTEAGLWKVVLTVTGTGASVTEYVYLAVPSITAAIPGSYATIGDLIEWTHDDPPADATRLLQRASEYVLGLTATAVYDVDGDGVATDVTVLAALRDATAAQAAWWIQTGDETGGAAQYTSVGIGSVQLTRSTAGVTSTRQAPDVLRILAAAGLLSGPVQVW